MSDPESSLSDRILDISPSSFDKWYGFGHRDARQTAARLAKDSDVRIATLEAEAKRLHRWVEGESQGAGLSPNTVDAAIEIANERGKQVERLVAEVERLKARIPDPDDLRTVLSWSPARNDAAARVRDTIEDTGHNEIRAAVNRLLDVLDAHEVESLDCDRRGNHACECLSDAVARIRDALKGATP